MSILLPTVVQFVCQVVYLCMMMLSLISKEEQVRSQFWAKVFVVTDRSWFKAVMFGSALLSTLLLKKALPGTELVYEWLREDAGTLASALFMSFSMVMMLLCVFTSAAVVSVTLVAVFDKAMRPFSPFSLFIKNQNYHD